jgi:hypothetical protein
MKLNGMRGRRNGKDVKCPTRYKYYAIQLVTTKRDVETVREGKNTTIDNIEIRYDTDEHLIKNLHTKESIMTKMNRDFLNAKKQ